MIQEARQRWEELTRLLDRCDRGGVRALSVDEVRRLCQLYRQVTIDLSRARGDGDDPDLVRYLNLLAARAHGQVYAVKPVSLGPLFDFVLGGFPRLVRRHARPLLVSTAVFVLASLASFLAVVRDPELAYSLFDEDAVEFENVRLEKQNGEYRGNFTFSLEASPLVAALIIGHNIRVAAVVFALGALLCLPEIILLVFNGRMLGTLTGLVWLHGYFLDFYALILTHGVLELTAICVAGGAGLMLGWAVISPGALPRRDALARAARDALGLFGGAALLLVVAGTIEAYVTPHFSQPVRWSVAAASAVFLVVYFGFAGRQRPAAELRVVRGP
ncbi:MAG TPA: stage II sporulation protein M [Gemmataceae bacterium]|nr:stage II sporulation protein M [Gemmataceae bacterium]